MTPSTAPFVSRSLEEPPWRSVIVAEFFVASRSSRDGLCEAEVGVDARDHGAGVQRVLEDQGGIPLIDGTGWLLSRVVWVVGRVAVGGVVVARVLPSPGPADATRKPLYQSRRADRD